MSAPAVHPMPKVVECSCAMSDYDSCACAGMLLLTHGTHMHLSCVRASLADALPTPDDLVPAVRQWRKGEAVRQQCQCCCNVESMLATAVARGCGPAALIRTLAAHCIGYARGYGVSFVLYPSYVLPHPCTRL